MQTLTPTTTLRWIKRLTAIVESCTAVIDKDSQESLGIEVWRATRNARTEAIIVRDELLELVVAAVEVESADV